MTAIPEVSPETLTLDVALLGDDRAALLRILSTLQRRRCVVTRVDFQGATRDHPGRLSLELLPPDAHRHVVGAWLRNLVDVRDVVIRR